MGRLKYLQYSIELWFYNLPIRVQMAIVTIGEAFWVVGIGISSNTYWIILFLTFGFPMHWLTLKVFAESNEKKYIEYCRKTLRDNIVKGGVQPGFTEQGQLGLFVPFLDTDSVHLMRCAMIDAAKSAQYTNEQSLVFYNMSAQLQAVNDVINEEVEKRVME